MKFDLHPAQNDWHLKMKVFHPDQVECASAVTVCADMIVLLEPIIKVVLSVSRFPLNRLWISTVGDPTVQQIQVEALDLVFDTWMKVLGFFFDVPIGWP